MKTNDLKPLSMAIGAALLSSSLATGAFASENPFSATELEAGYQLASNHSLEEGKCGEGKCGGDKDSEEGKCGEGKCGADKDAEEGKCGEGKCGADKDAEEGKCGEGKCGGSH